MRDLRRYRKELATTLEDWDERGAVDGDICGLIEGTQMEAEPIAASALKRRKKDK